MREREFICHKNKEQTYKNILNISTVAGYQKGKPIKLVAYTLCLKNDTDVAGYIFNEHQPILVVFGRDVGERVCYSMVICYPTSPTNVSALPGET